jgi:hypothetical protein
VRLKRTIPGASQKNIANYFFLWGKPISQCCLGNILSEKNTVSIYSHPHFNANIGG